MGARAAVFTLAGCLLSAALSYAAAPPGFEAITVENAASVQILTTLTDYHDATDYCACDVRIFSQNGRALATDWKIYDLATGAALTFTGRGYPLALSPDGVMGLVSGQDNGTRLVEVATGTERELMADDAEDAAFSLDGSLVVVSSQDADAVQVWDVAEATLLTTLGRPQFGGLSHPQFTPDGRYLIWQDRLSTLHIWDVGKQDELRPIASNVFDFTLTADGATVVLQKSFEVVEAWDIASGDLLGRVTDDHDQSGVDVYALSPDRRTLAINYFGGNARLELWNIASQPHEKIAELENSSNGRLLFTPDSRMLLLASGRTNFSCSREGTGCGGYFGGGSREGVEVIDTTTGESIGIIGNEDNFVNETFLSPDGQLMITAGYFEGVHLWRVDGTTAELLAVLPGRDFVLSPDGSTLLVQLDRNLLAVYGIATAERPVRPFLLTAHIHPSVINVRAEPSAQSEVVATASGDVRVLGRSADSSYVYVPDHAGWVRADPTFINLVSDMPIETLVVLDESQAVATLSTPTAAPLPTPTVQPTVIAAANLDGLRLNVGAPLIPPPEAPDGLIPISTQNVGEVTLLAVLPHGYVETSDFPSAVPAVSVDGTHLITPPTEQNPHATVWDLRTFRAQEGPEIGDDFFMVMAASPDGDHIAYNTDDIFAPVMLWSAESDTEVTLGSVRGGMAILGTALTFSPDGRLLAYAGGLLDVSSRQVSAQIEDVGGMSFSADSRLLAVKTYERVYIYDTHTGELRARTPRVGEFYSEEELQVAQFSPDGTYLAAISYTHVFLFDTATGELLYSLPTSGEHPTSTNSPVHFSPDGQTLALLTPSGILELWETCTGDALGAYDTGGAQGVAFSPDGRLLAVGNPLRLINLSAGTMTTIPGDYGGAYMTFTPDGSTLLVDGSTNKFQEIQAVMAFGIPTTERPAWMPITAEVVPEGINVRSSPESASPVVGTARGQVVVAGRDADGQAVFLPEAGGWVWSDANYLDLGETPIAALPVLDVD